MSSVIDSIERKQLRRVPTFQAGDRLRVHFQVVEGTRRRTQVFDGVVIKIQGNGARETFTVRKQSFGVGVERTFPLHSPKIEKIEVASRGDVRRAKLYYLRDRVGRRARVRERVFTGAEQEQYAEMADAQGALEEAPVLVEEATGEVAEVVPEGEDAAAVEAEGGTPDAEAAGDGEGEGDAPTAEAGGGDDATAEADAAADPPDEAEQE
ncbi:MAG: large subunit ribosomal protein [Thermoleophilaceae bacterium]|jgi:large subunit ribosomal protein L19|nr:large subunit ribosomal protein [Thermoleophilaceae bacterium]